MTVLNRIKTVGVDRMCREPSAISTKKPQHHLDAFIMKASVWANLLEEGQEKGARKDKKNLLDLIKANPYISASSIAKECGMSVKTIRNLIDELREDQLCWNFLGAVVIWKFWNRHLYARRWLSW